MNEFDRALARIDRDGLDCIYDATRALARGDRGRKMTLRAVAGSAAIVHASAALRASGVVGLVLEWMGEDHPKRLETPPTEKVTAENLLVGLFACAYSNVACSVQSVHHTLTSDMSRATRAAAGFPTSDDPDEDARLDNERRDIAYSTVAWAFKRVGLVIDPRPYPSRRGLTQEEIDEVDAARDIDQMNKRQRRAEVFIATLLISQVFTLPAAVRANWTGGIAPDGTVLPGWGRFGHNSKKRAIEGSRSPEANSGWHAKKQDERDAASMPGVKRLKTWTAGYDAIVSFMRNPPEAPPVPGLVVGLAMDTPGRNPGLNLAASLVGLVEAGLPVGTAVVDLGFSQQFGENYAFRMVALGYDLMHMFDSDELGKVLATWRGLSVVEGTVYGPCLPHDLRMAAEDFKENRIGRELFEARIEARRAYQARRKSKQGGDVWLYRCPGQGSGRTCDCPLKPPTQRQLAVEADGRRALPLVFNAPDIPPPSCANSESVSVPAEKFARYVTKYPYKTPEFNAYYGPTRNFNEGANNRLKNVQGPNIAQPGERRFRGFGQQLLTLVAKICAANHDEICNWIDDEEDGMHVVVAGRNKGRPVRPGLSAYRPDPSGVPLKIVGSPIESESA